MQSGFFDRSRLLANILMVLLVALNIFFSIQYTQNIKKQDEAQIAEADKIEYRLQTAQFMKFFIDKVLGTNGTIAFEDRVKLEADIRAFNDDTLLKQWDVFVTSKDSETAQQSAVRLMSMLSNRMI
jgi:Ca2+/Na+ antiporter